MQSYQINEAERIHQQQSHVKRKSEENYSGRKQIAPGLIEIQKESINN